MTNSSSHGALRGSTQQQTSIHTATHWWLAFRPKTLTAAVVPVVVGTALLTVTSYSVQWWISIFALASALMIQIGTNLVNDALDFEKGADNDDRIGPKRVTASGSFSSKQVLYMAYFSFATAVLLGLPLVWHGGWPIVAIGVFSVICGYAYTGGPYPLAYTGLGDLFVVLFFGLVAVGGIFYLHSGVWNYDVLVAGLQVGFLCTVLIAINNLRDIEGDKKVDKKTLAVRFGKGFVRTEILLLTFLPFLMGVYWWQQGHLWVAALPLLTLPLAINLVKKVFLTEPSPAYNLFLGQSALLHVVFGLLLALGLGLS